MKTIVLFILMMIIGVAGLILFFGGHENIAWFIISKPIGIMLLTASYMLYKRLKSEILRSEERRVGKECRL